MSSSTPEPGRHAPFRLSEGLLGPRGRDGGSGQLLDGSVGGRIPGYTAHGPLRIGRVPVQRSDRQFFLTRKMARGMRMEERVRGLVRGYRNPDG